MRGVSAAAKKKHHPSGWVFCLCVITLTDDIDYRLFRLERIMRSIIPTRIRMPIIPNGIKNMQTPTVVETEESLHSNNVKSPQRAQINNTPVKTEIPFFIFFRNLGLN